MQYDKPGCFGHATNYSEKSKTCLECDDRNECALIARQRLTELSSLISVDSILKMSHKSTFDPTKPQLRFDSDLPATAQKLIAMLPQNAQRTAAQLLRMKVNFRKLLLGNVNPIKDQKPLAVSVLFDLLLQGPVDRFTYMLVLKDKLGHSPATAASQASIGYAIAVGLGIAKLEGEKLIIRG